MAAKKPQKTLFAEILCIFGMSIEPKSNYSRFSTLVILSDHMEDYYACLKVILKLALH